MIACNWMRTGRTFGGLVYCKPLGITIAQGIDDLELIAHAMSADELRNSVQYIPL